MPVGEGAAARLPPVAMPLAVIVVALLAGGGFLLATKQQELAQVKTDLAQSQRAAATLESEKQALTQQLESSQHEVKDLEERLSSLRTQLTSASQDLEHTRQVFDDLKGRYDTVAKERDQLQTQVVSVTSERDELRKRGEEWQHNKEELERAVSRLRERFALLDRDYKKLADQLEEARLAPSPTLSVIGAAGPATTGAMPPGSEQIPPAIPQAVVELPPIVVRKDQAGMAVPVRGRVLDVNPSHNFVVVDKGSVDGVRIGMTFDLVRGAETVGRATVVRVRPQLSACDIVRARTPGPVQSGDLAVQNGP